MAADLIFYHAPQTRSAIAFWMLEETGAEYDMKLLNIKTGDQNKPDYLAVNPQGKVPAIRHKGVVVTEAAAVCAYLADAFPAANLAPRADDPQRGAYLRYLVMGPVSLEGSMLQKMMGWSVPEERAGAVPFRAFETVAGVFEQTLAAGPYLLGEQFTAADVVVGSTLNYARMFGALTPGPNVARYLDTLDARPALKRMREKDTALAEKQRG